MQGDHIRLGHAARIDALGGLHLGQRADAVAQGGGAFELHCFGCGGHLGGQRFLHRRGFARQELLGILDRACVIGGGDVIDARARAALDLIQQTGPGAVLECRLRTGAQQEHLLQLIQGPVDRARAGKGAIIAALFRLGPAVFGDQRIGMILGHQNIRE